MEWIDCVMTQVIDPTSVGDDIEVTAGRADVVSTVDKIDDPGWIPQ